MIPGNYFDGKGAAPQDGGIQRVGLEVNAPAANAGGISLNPGIGVVAGASGAWTEQLQQLTATAESEVAKLTPGPSENERQVYIERHVYLRMLYLMAGQQERALQYIPGIDPADQEFWQQVFWGTANYFDRQGIQNAADRAAQTTAQFNAAVLRLKEKANLELRNLSFCHTISSFGNYERYPRDEFSPGQPVLLYAELANFHCELTADGRYRTLVRSSIEIYKPGAQGELIEKIEYRPTEDVCRNHRRDYFHSYQIDVPRKLALGPHVMKLTIEDQLSQKVATSSLNFTVK